MITNLQIKSSKPLAEAKEGDTVKVQYTGKLQDGTVFDQSEDESPLEFTIGEGKLIPAFEEAVSGMSVGDKKSVDISKDDAYGEPREDLKMDVSKEDLPEDIDPQVGMQLQVKNQETGKDIPVRITEVEEEQITIDANHPLAGQDLTFDIELVEISEDEGEE